MLIFILTIIDYKQTQVTMADFHQEQLEMSCWVCGNRLRTSRGKGRAFDCSTNAAQLLETFSLDVRSDNRQTQPTQFCFSCHGVIRRKASAVKKGLPYTTAHNTFLPPVAQPFYKQTLPAAPTGEFKGSISS